MPFNRCGHALLRVVLRLKGPRITSASIVIPAKAGIQWRCDQFSRDQSGIYHTARIANRSHWIPACAGMTGRRGFFNALQSLRSCLAACCVATEGTSNNLRLHRHPGAGRDPVALRSVLARPIRDLSHSENRKPEPLDSGLRRNDGWGRIFLMPFNRYGRALLRVVLRLKRSCRCKLAAAVDELLLYAGRSPAAW